MNVRQKKKLLGIMELFGVNCLGLNKTKNENCQKKLTPVFVLGIGLGC